jgi:hypothetical protein
MKRHAFTTLSSSVLSMEASNCNRRIRRRSIYCIDSSEHQDCQN